MILRTADGYFDFNEDVEVNRQALLFEALNETRGDFSYQSSMPKTSNNLSLLGMPFVDVANKRIYRRIEVDLLSNSGEVLYTGFLKVEDINDVINFRFFSGNSNWLSLLTGNMTELELSDYDREQTRSEIVDSWSDSEGIVFPLIDNGALISRSYISTVRQDFLGCFYLHTLFKEVFNQSGLKITGELLNDPLFNSMVLSCNTRSKVDVDNNSIFVGKNDNQVIPIGSVLTWVNFNVLTDPYSVGSAVTFSSDTYYYAASEMYVDLDVHWEASHNITGSLLLNGSGPVEKAPGVNASGYGDNVTISVENYHLQAGDYIGLRVFNDQGTTATITKATFRVKPTYVFKAFGSSTVPLWTKLKFVSNVLALFNAITDYDPFSKTVTINLFNKIKSKTPVDLSQYINFDNVNFSDFVSNYGKSTTLSYKESDEEDLSEYNISSFIKYGAGVIAVNNDFIQESAPLLDSDFSAPLSYINSVLDCSLEKISFVELEDSDEVTITGVTDSAGVPRFAIDNDYFLDGDLVRIEADEFSYNGIYQVVTVGSGYIEVRGLTFNVNSGGKITKVVHNLTTDQNVYLFVNVPSYDVEDFSQSQTGLYLDDVFYTSAGLAFFSLINNDTQINTDYKQSLSLGAINDPQFYQRTLLQTYWRLVDNVLNDPVKLHYIAYLPVVVYKQLSPLSPVFLLTKETQGLYYCNRITGYKGSDKPCELELIKLS
jgi:hypothetical protein